MAGTAKILKDINNTREEIAHIIDLLSRKRNSNVDIKKFILEKPLNVAVIAIILGIFAAMFSGKFKGLLKFILFIYTTKQSISYLFKK